MLRHQRSQTRRFLKTFDQQRQNTNGVHNETSIMGQLGRGIKKPRIFYGQADRKGGGSAQLALTIRKGENFDPFFSMEYDSMKLNTHFFSLWGVTKMHF